MIKDTMKKYYNLFQNLNIISSLGYANAMKQRINEMDNKIDNKIDNIEFNQLLSDELIKKANLCVKNV